MNKAIQVFTLASFLVACNPTEKTGIHSSLDTHDTATVESTTSSFQPGRYTTDAGVSVNPSSNATSAPGIETNGYFNFQSDSSYHRGDDPIHRGSQAAGGNESEHLMNEDNRALSGSASSELSRDEATENVKDRSQVTQYTSRTLESTEMIETIQNEIRNNINLSEGAHNTKITAQNGQIYLRGIVENNSEKATVEKIAKRIAGNNLVINQLDVKNR